MSVQEDDVIVFYYSGHGKRTLSQNDPYPIFDFEYDDSIISHYDVTWKLIEKKPRLIISIADCCNVYDDDNLNYNPMFLEKKINAYVKKNWEDLFLNSHGTYIAASALPGEASISLGESDKEIGVPGGSFYTNAIIETLNRETNKSHERLTWELIFDTATNLTIQYQLRDSDDPVIYHHPQYEYIP